MPSPLRLAATLLLTLLAAAPAYGQISIQPDLRVRTGLLSTHGVQRTGATHDQAPYFAARIQAGAIVRLNAALSVNARLATRLAGNEAGPIRLRAPDDAPGPDGLAPGDVALEHLTLSWMPTDAIGLRVGRYQSDHALPSVAKKGLLRFDNSGFSVQWNDGAALQLSAPTLGRLDFEVAATPRRGIATSLRAPLRFDDGGALLFASWSSREAAGPLSHRAVQILAHPSAVPDADDRLGPLVAFAGQAGVGVPLPDGAFLLAAEAGWTLTAPDRSAVGVPGAGEAGAFAGQVSANWTDLGGQHDIGIVLAAAGSGWLTSSSVRPNNIEQEVRYHWRFRPGWRFDVRVRHRQDLIAPLGAERRRGEIDTYLRLTVRL